MDGPLRWWRGKNYEAWIPAGQSYGPVLLQSDPSSRNFLLEHATTNCVSVSQVKQRGADENDGTKTETNARAAAAEELNSDRGVWCVDWVQSWPISTTSVPQTGCRNFGAQHQVCLTFDTLRVSAIRDFLLRCCSPVDGGILNRD